MPYKDPEKKKENAKIRYNTPERQAYMKVYRQSATCKASAAKRRNSDKGKEYHRVYGRTEKYKAKAALYRNKPANKIRRKLRGVIYYKTPIHRYRIYRVGAEQRDLSFDLTMEQFMLFWQLPCSYCSDPIETIGLDRIDGSRGYAIDNVVPCCFPCNTARMCQSQADFISRCARIAKHCEAHPPHAIHSPAQLKEPGIEAPRPQTDSGSAPSPAGQSPASYPEAAE
jgi:hypothetical protein